MAEENIRWLQRFENFQKAFFQLESAVKQSQKTELSELEKQGLIQSFEFTHELAWNVLKDYFAYQGNSSISGSRDAVREAFSKGIIEDGETWMDMIKSRNKSTHTYNVKIANEISENIVKKYHPLFSKLIEKLKSLQQ